MLLYLDPHLTLCYDPPMGQALSLKKDFSAGGIVWDPPAKKVLMIYVQNLGRQKVWTFPKGHPEAKETDEQAALREVQEETGWEAKILRHLMDVRYFYVHKDTKYKKRVRWFFMAPARKIGEFNPDEILDCEWIPLDEAQMRITYETDKKLLEKLRELVSS